MRFRGLKVGTLIEIRIGESNRNCAIQINPKGGNMKKLITVLALVGATSNVYAFDAQLESGQSVSVQELVESGVDKVACRDVEPRCILMDTEVGIQYPGQTLEDVEMDNKYNDDAAIRYVRMLKEEGLCK